MISIDPKTIPKPELFKHMLSAIGPRPIALASTIDKNGKSNLAPFSFFNIFSINPPTLIFSPSRRGKDSTTKHTYENIKEVPEVVINVVTYSMVHQTNLASTEYPKDIDEFEKAGFTPETSELIKPNRVKESPVQIECKVVNVIETGTGGGAGNLVICEILKVHFEKNILDDNGFIDTLKLDLVGRMGGNYWCRASGDAIFEVNKPVVKNAIGFDQIPLDIRLSKILTGNDLGQLGMVESLPLADEIEQEKQNREIKNILKSFKNESNELKIQIHQLARKYIEKKQIDKAWRILLAVYK